MCFICNDTGIIEVYSHGSTRETKHDGIYIITYNMYTQESCPICQEKEDIDIKG